MRPNYMYLPLAFGYLRLSREEGDRGESASIINQRRIIREYCQHHGISLVRFFVDDGWSGGNFDRPDFQKMIRELDQGKANMVITKDLSRLGRDMRESSYYAEQYFPENGIRYIAIAENFDTEHENVMAPFQFAMNEVYLRDGSRKVKDVLRSKRQDGLYCACPPYGYKKAPNDVNQLIPDEVTAPVVQQIFKAAAAGTSSHRIAAELNEQGVIPPLKYRVLYRDKFSEEGAARASDLWNHTTVKRILKNQVYLGHTVLGKTRKASVKSKKKVKVPQEEWCITRDTHEPLVSQGEFDLAQFNLGRNSRSYRDCENARISIFGGIAFCARCGHALCSGGGVYKGDRIKYWQLYCNHQRKDVKDPCQGVHVKYADLVEVVRRDLNQLLDMTEEEMRQMVEELVRQDASEQKQKEKRAQLEMAKARQTTIDRIITKLYTDNAEGRLEDERLAKMVAELEQESAGLCKRIEELSAEDTAGVIEGRYQQFFDLARDYTHIQKLDRETLLTFVDRIEVGPKILPEGFERPPRKNQKFQQEIRIFYKFIGELGVVPEPPILTVSGI